MTEEELRNQKAKICDLERSITEGEQCLFEEQHDMQEYKKDLDEALVRSKEATEAYRQMLQKTQSDRFDAEQCKNMKTMAEDDVYFANQWVEKCREFYNKSMDRQNIIKEHLDQIKAEHEETTRTIRGNSSRTQNGRNCLGSLIVWAIILILLLRACGKI